MGPARVSKAGIAVRLRIYVSATVSLALAMVLPAILLLQTFALMTRLY
jgi:hypothetical protein